MEFAKSHGTMDEMKPAAGFLQRALITSYEINYPKSTIRSRKEKKGETPTKRLETKRLEQCTTGHTQINCIQTGTFTRSKSSHTIIRLDDNDFVKGKEETLNRMLKVHSTRI